MSIDRKKILLVDDDPEIRSLFKEYLKKYAFAVTTTSNGEETITAIKREKFHIIILDLMLPDVFGADLCKSIREITTTPILLLTASEEEQDYILGLESGADDYAQKSTGLPVILAKIKAILRKEEVQKDRKTSTGIPYKVAEFSGWKFTPRESQLTSPDGASIFLTENEVNVLLLFLENAQKILSRDTIGERLGIGSHDNFYRAVDIIISRLRNKIKKVYKKAKLIKTIRHKGYQFLSGVSYD